MTDNNIQKNMSTTNLLLDSLDRRSATYRVKLRDCRDKFSEKAVHDLRSSVRRLQATIEITGYVVSSGGARKLSESFDELLNGFNDLRDAQVMLENIEENISFLPELEPFQKYLKGRENDLQDAAENYSKDLKLGNINKRLLKIREKLSHPADDQARDRALQAVDDAYRAVMQHYWEVEPKDPESIHQLRVAFKKFRYMIEDIQSLLKNFPEGLLKQLHDYQTLMGRIQDGDVFLTSLGDFAEQDASYDPLPVRRYYEQMLSEALSVYMKHKDELLTFWRATPLSEFPWHGELVEKEEHP